MAAMVEPTVFAKDWKCGDTLKPTVDGRIIERTVACKIPSQRRNVGRGNLARTYDWKFFEKRHGEEIDCAAVARKHTKRHGPEGDGEMMAAAPAAAPAVAPAAAPAAQQPKPAAGAADAVTFDTKKPWEWGQKTGFVFEAGANAVNEFNKITVEKGKGAFARVPAGMYNEKFFGQSHANGLMSLGAQHGVSIHKPTPQIH
jgi:hypothetical protein